LCGWPTATALYHMVRQHAYNVHLDVKITYETRPLRFMLKYLDYTLSCMIYCRCFSFLHYSLPAISVCEYANVAETCRQKKHRRRRRNHLRR